MDRLHRRGPAEPGGGGHGRAQPPRVHHPRGRSRSTRRGRWRYRRYISHYGPYNYTRPRWYRCVFLGWRRGSDLLVLLFVRGLDESNRIGERALLTIRTTQLFGQEQYDLDISSVWVYSVKYSARWVENVFFPTLNYKYILHQH